MKRFKNIKKITSFWETLVDTVTFVKTHQRWDTYSNKPHPKINHPCHYLWERMYVWYDGLCNPCDVDYKSELQVGSIKENSIKDIWTGEKYQKLRKLHLDGNRNSCYPCDRCPIGD